MHAVFPPVATLGFVEFLLHLLAEYYTQYDAAKKHVFGDVHFLLFYTAIFNAFQTVLTAVVSSRVAQNLWVKTELLALNHYVEIRLEFDRVQRELDRLHEKDKFKRILLSSAEKKSLRESVQDRANNQRNNEESSVEAAEQSAFSWSWSVLCGNIGDTLRYPRLRRKYDVLLTQVRFHELRMHFLQSYDLPLKLKVSDYLIRRKTNVLRRFVNVSSTAWLLLTACVCLLYYVLGMINYEYQDQELVGRVMTGIFFGFMTISALIVWVVSFKMQSIFFTIMKDKTLWDVHGSSKVEKERLSKQQLALFWSGEPKNVIDLIQFLQFGYGVALSTVIVFWREMNDGAVGMHWFMIAIGLCYAHFVHVSGHILPMFILCTSLGQLVDERVLHATVALFRLEEAKQKQLELLDMDSSDARGYIFQRTLYALNDGDTKRKASGPEKLSKVGNSRVLVARASNPAETLLRVRSRPGTNLSPVNSEDTENSDIVKRHQGAAISRRRRQLRKTMSENVGNMRRMLLEEDKVKSEPEIMTTTQSRRHARKKSVSDGVAYMARISNIASSFSGEAEYHVSRRDEPSVVDDGVLLAKLVRLDTTRLQTFLPSDYDQRRRDRQYRTKSASDGVAAMRNCAFQDEGLFSASRDEVHMCNSLDRLGVSSNSKDMNSKARHARKKSFSDGVVLMANKALTLNIGITNEKLSSIGSTDHPLTVDRPAVYMHTESLEHKKLPVLSVPCEPVTPTLPLISAVKNFPTMQEFDIDEEGAVSEAKHIHTTIYPELRASASEALHAYFLSKRHIVVSNVFGTVVAFFLVGMRIEGFIYSDNKPDYFVSLHLPLRVSFWILAVLLSCFLVASALVLYLFRSCGNAKKLNELRVAMAAMIDVVIVLGCLTVLIVAEINRCCEILSADNLRDTVDAGYAYCTCPTFGTRTYGGLGTIEPYSSLVFLRMIRHWIARRLVYPITFDVELIKPEVNMYHSSSHRLDNDESDFFLERTESEFIAETNESIAEAWETAISARPDIVARYGAFSGEILQIMLGLGLKATPLSSSKERSKVDIDEPDHGSNRSFALNNEYAGLSVEAQEVILAGKLGRALVKSQSTTTLDVRSMAIDENSEISPPNLGPQKSMMFEIKSDPEVVSDEFIFTSANARLICSMRRCDRMFLPLLDQWTCVDVVMTRFEIIYFDAVGVDERVGLNSAQEGIRQALIATRGGEGLRLGDVAVGRHIVGRLAIEDIASIHVERTGPSSRRCGGGDSDSGLEPNYLPEKENQTEFWMRNSDLAVNMEPQLTRKRQWNSVFQDTLTIETSLGYNLFLRFYSDLKGASLISTEDSSENLLNSGIVYENVAFHWAQTIGRLCGREQLINKQSLPHLGDNTNAELHDYLVVVSTPNQQGGNAMSNRLIKSPDLHLFRKKFASTRKMKS